MREVFIEDSSKIVNESKSKSYYHLFSFLSYCLFAIAFVWFFALILSVVDNITEEDVFAFIILYCLPFLIFIGLGVLFYFKKNSFYVEYDYSFVSGTVKISKVIMNKKRKFLSKFDCAEIEKIGKKGSYTYNNYLKMPATKKIILSSNKTPAENKDFYYIVVKKNKGKEVYVFECKKDFILQIINYKGLYVLDKDFK